MVGKSELAFSVKIFSDIGIILFINRGKENGSFQSPCLLPMLYPINGRRVIPFSSNSPNIIEDTLKGV